MDYEPIIPHWLVHRVLEYGFFAWVVLVAVLVAIVLRNFAKEL